MTVMRRMDMTNTIAPLVYMTYRQPWLELFEQASAEAQFHFVGAELS